MVRHVGYSACELLDYSSDISQKMKFSIKDFFSKCDHGTKIRTEITCKKIPCFMRDSTCK